MITRTRDKGFTLVEILVALAVAGGALVLVLSANAASLARSVRSRADARLERAIEARLAEWRVGAETSHEGPLAGFDGHRWETRSTAEQSGGLKRLARITLRVYGPDGKVVAERTELVHGRR